LLKHTFAVYHDKAPLRSERRRVHVFFGAGSAALRWLAQYCEWLLDAFPNIQVCAVGRGDRNAMQALERRHAARLDWQEQVDDMAAHMATCDVAVGGPGSATWERACVGLASALVATSENQVPVLRVLDGARFSQFIGSVWELDVARFTAGVAVFLDDTGALSDMRARGVTAVDGRGVDRIVRRLARQEHGVD
jgi:UDP-2,4-diacetamido-2,4,6-trideoxy-beta-L-altropyranose hydrolase